MKIKLLCLLISGFVCSQNLSAQNIDSVLVRNYPFTGNAYDLSSYNDTAIVHSATLTNDRFGDPNSAYSFDGTTSYISFDTAGIINDEFSISIWAKYAGTTPGGLIYLGDAGSDDQGITTGAGNNGWTLGSYNADHSVLNVFSGVTPSTTTWTHLVFVRNSSSITLYVNGVFNDSTATSGKMASFGSNPVGVIGRRSDGTAKFKGDLDDIRIYGRAITSAEALILYQGTTTSVDEIVKPVDFTVYPNPTTAGKELKFTSTQTISGIEVFDVSGKAQNVAIDMDYNSISGLKSGVYFVRITTDSGTATKKIVVQ